MASDAAVARLRKKNHGLNEKRKETRKVLDRIRTEMLLAWPDATNETFRVSTKTAMGWIEALRKECAR